MAPSHKTAAWGPIRSLLCLSPLFIFVPWFVVRDLYGNHAAIHLTGSPVTYLVPFFSALPEPVTEL